MQDLHESLVDFRELLESEGIANDFKDCLLTAYNYFILAFPEVDCSALLETLPSGAVLRELQAEFNKGEFVEYLHQMNLLTTRLFIQAEWQIHDITHILFMLQNGMDFSDDKRNEFFIFYIPFTIFLMALSGIDGLIEENAPQEPNVVKFRSRSVKKLEARLALVDEFVDDVGFFLEEKFDNQIGSFFDAPEEIDDEGN